MRLSVDYDESDVAKILSELIKHKNKDEFIKLLTPYLSADSKVIHYFFKLYIDGNKLPEVIPNNSLCKIHVSNLGYNCNKENIKNTLADSDGAIVVTVKRFLGYHSYLHYEIEYTNVMSDGSTETDFCNVSFDSLKLLEEF